MDNLYTLTTALKYSEQGKTEEWVHLFLNGEGSNVPFSKGLKLEKRYFISPTKMPLNLFTRCCGPEENMKFTVDKTGFEYNINAISERLKTGWDMPPLIVNYGKDGFVLNDGNHRYEVLIRNGYTEYYVIVWITSEDDYNSFINVYN